MGGFSAGKIFRREHFPPALGIIFDHQLQGAQHTHQPRGMDVQVLPDAVFQKARVHLAVGFRHADPLAEIPDGCGRIAPAAQAGNRWHAGIIPAGHNPFIHQSFQIPLAHNRPGQVEPGKFILMRHIFAFAVLDHPVIERPVRLKFQRADGMGDALIGILQGMGEVIHGIDDPFAARAVVFGMADAIDHRVAHVDVGRSHIDFGPQHLFAVGESAGPHLLKQLQVFLHRTAAEGAFLPWLGERPPGLADLLGAQVADKGQPFFDEPDGAFVHIFKIIGCIELIFPGKAQPMDILFNGADIFLILLGGVCVVIAQIARAAVLLGQTKVQADRLGMSDMQIAVGFRGEPSQNMVMPSGRQICVDDLLNKVPGAHRSFFGFHGVVFHIQHPSRASAALPYSPASFARSVCFSPPAHHASPARCAWFVSVSIFPFPRGCYSSPPRRFSIILPFFCGFGKGRRGRITCFLYIFSAGPSPFYIPMRKPQPQPPTAAPPYNRRCPGRKRLPMRPWPH